jgi:hypothetical protein
MPIRAGDLRTLMLRVSADAKIGAALKDIRERLRPEEWLLLYPLDGGYAVISVAELARRSTSNERLLDRTFADLALAASPIVDLETELAEAQALLGATGFVVVLRDDRPYGVLVRPATRPPASLIQLLLGQAASWQPATGGVLGVEESIPKTPTPAQPSFEPVPRRADRYVNTDFATAGEPGRALAKTLPLQPGEWYFFRLNVGELEATTIEATPTLLPDVLLQQDVDVDVVVFSERFTIERATGALRVPTDGPATVKTPASLPGGMDASAPLTQERLLFRVRAPAEIGTADLRVCLYCNGMLVQSRLVTAVVGTGQALSQAGAMRVSVVDFDLSPTLAPGHLGDIAPHKLSLMVNASADGTHAFRLFGQEGNEVFQSSATISPVELTDLIKQARNVLQQVAWGYIGDWDGRTLYRYDPPSAAQANWRDDVIRLAVQGYRLYDNRIRSLAGSGANEDRLRKLMRAPGMLQLASKVSANDVVPIAMFYDYDLDTQAPSLTICPQFEASLQSGRDLLGEPCFQGNCPHREGSLTIVCPSGFWGFRHDIGMPWPAPGGPEMAKTIGFAGTPLMDVAFFQFAQLGDHLEKLGGLGYQTQRQQARDAAIQMFRGTQPQVVYFYCHGVTIKQTEETSIPALKIGSDAAPGFFDTTSFRPYRIRWPEARPLVFVNGCHTTQISPEQALSFVRVFIETVEASGVIGTEITIFEPLAQRFAEAFLKAFRGGEPLGRALRRARLELLAAHNPLGLVYQPFAYAGLRLGEG